MLCAPSVIDVHVYNLLLLFVDLLVLSVLVCRMLGTSWMTTLYMKVLYAHPTLGP